MTTAPAEAAVLDLRDSDDEPNSGDRVDRLDRRDRDDVQSIPFGGLQIGFHGDVLRPRPWTRAQSTWGAALTGVISDRPVLELCSGAGQIGLELSRLTGRPLIQVDVSPEACAWARRNAERNGLAGRVEVRLSCMADACAPDERFDLILADPPYVPSSHTSAHPDDPALAVDGGPDGLDLIREVLHVVSRHAAPHGAVLLQVRGSEQADAVAELIHDEGHTRLSIEEVRTFARTQAIMLLRAAG